MFIPTVTSTPLSLSSVKVGLTTKPAKSSTSMSDENGVQKSVPAPRRSAFLDVVSRLSNLNEARKRHTLTNQTLPQRFSAFCKRDYLTIEMCESVG